MKIKFRPYLDIKDDKQLKLLLNRQNSLEENFFNLSSITEYSSDSFQTAVKRLKDFYGFTPKSDIAKFADELVYHMLITQYYYVFNIQYIVKSNVSNEKEALINITNESTIGNIVDQIDDIDLKETINSYIKFLCDEIADINEFVHSNYGDDFLEIKQYSFNDILEMNISDLNKTVSKIRCVIFTLVNHTKYLRLRSLAFNISNYRNDYSV